MGTSISTWENVSAYFTFADSPATLALFALGAVAIVSGLIVSIKKHEDKAFEEYK
jgi:hypothetical protein